MKKIIIFLISLSCLILFVHVQNNWLEITKIEIESNKITNDIKVIHISDLHNKDFGKNNSKLINKIKEENPDLIFITGDIIDSRRTNIDIAVNLSHSLVQIAPTFYVTGNQEVRSNKYDEITSKLSSVDVKVIDGYHTDIMINNELINIFGLSDPSFFDFNTYSLKNIDESNLNLLLSHRPDLFNLYAEYKVDIVFTGHAHGGQIRIPIVGPLIAPNQGFFPKLTEGVHNENSTSMIISRGLGNSIIPIRLFNRPEIISLTLVGTKWKK